MASGYNLCKKGCLEKILNDNNTNVVYDVLQGMACIPSAGRIYYIRYCPQCGEKIRYCSACSWDESELLEVQKKIKGISRKEDLFRILGNPDNVIDECEEHNVRKAYEYTGISRMYTVQFSENKNGKLLYVIFPHVANNQPRG